MNSKREQQSPPDDIERFREQLGLKIERLMAESLEAWPTCENKRCRREKRCASDNRECAAKWRESLPPLSPEQVKVGVEDLKLSLDVRRRLGDNVTLEQFEEAIRKEKAARRAAMPPQGEDTPAPAVAETPLAPEQQERIDRVWNDYAASLPAEDAATEDADERKRERRPRITQL